MDTVTDNSMEPRWPKRFTVVWNPPDVVLEQVHAGLLPMWDTNVGKKKKDLEIIRKGRAQFVPEVRGEHKKLGSGVIACSSHELSSYVGYMHSHSIL